MNFLTPWALLLSVAAAVPLLLHLLRRRTGDRVEFPALRYLLRAEREHAREVRLRNLLLLLVRIAMVLAVAGALARPVGPFPGVGHPPTALAIVLDNSASSAAVVGGSTILEAEKRAARDVLAAASDADRLSLVTMDGEVRSGSPDALRTALDALRPMDGAGDLAAALRRAEAAVAAAALPESRVVVLSDGQRSALAATVADSGSVPRSLYVVPGARPANRGIASVRLEPPYWNPRGALRAQLIGDSVAWRVEVAGRSVARGRSTDGVVLARVQDLPRGWHAGSVELDADDYRGDDRRYFAVHVGDAPGLTADAASPFLREAVATLVTSSRARAGGQVFIGSALRARRPAVLFAPADPLEITAANRALARAGVPWQFGLKRQGPAPLRGASVDGATATQWFSLTPLDGARADTIARVGSDAWAVAGEDYVLVASAADAGATDLTVRAAFVPWIDLLVSERLGAAEGRALEVAAAARVTVPTGVDALEFPDGESRPVAATAQIAAPSVAGVYFWRRGAARVGAIVVNAEARESELAMMPADSVAAALDAPRGESTPESLARAAFAAGGRRALDTPLLLLALVLVVAESWLARRGHAARSAD
ncbi:BatA and WFA domain-containing protein [Pseudogemmatithrix spongiicola]|uniref:BatA and WFA domain-containing protein n=1 Tax=Pseudogemmatithrix spongiicola TaxID=3062599 RepID=A0AA49JW39_9BACT|nr:BatA and WFA domain-containing protein [Gemmatimonadaceae bacterium 'strain 138']WKW15600.1 BatA and WFA domain-containing protein [Gemmatimonadaceae bacterium 'strain 318']